MISSLTMPNLARAFEFMFRTKLLKPFQQPRALLLLVGRGRGSGCA
jgi:hypothetical protein